MSLVQERLNISFLQTQGIFNEYAYNPENGDAILDVLTDGYFAQSRFLGQDGWIGGLITCNLSDGVFTIQITGDGTTSVIIDWGIANTDFIPGKTVANFSALPAANLYPDKLAICLNSQGVWFVNYKAAGIYYSDGATWIYQGDYELTDEASEIGVTPAGNITATNVQAALQELDTIKAGTGFTTATTTGANIVGTLGTNGISMGIPAYLTTGGGGGGGIALSAGPNSTSTGTVVFSNANGLTFGMDTNAVVTASYTVPIVPAQTEYVFSNSNNISFGTNGSTVTATASFIQTVQPAVGLNTAQTNVTWTVNSSGISIDAGGYAGTGFTSTTTAGTAIVATNNTAGLSIGVPAFLTTTRIDYNLLSAVGNTSGTNRFDASNFDNIVLSGGNNVTLSGSGNTLGISVGNYITTQTVQPAVGLNTAQTNVTWTVNSSGISINAGGYAGTGFTSTTTAGTAIVATNNTAGLSIGVPTIITNALTTQTVQPAVGLNTAQTNVTWTVNSSGISINASGYAGIGTTGTNATLTLDSSGIKLNAGGYAGTGTTGTNATMTLDSSGLKLNAGGYAGTGLTLNVTNLSTSATLNSNGLNLSINNVDDHAKGYALYGNTSGTSASTYTTTQPIYLKGGENITLSGSSDSVVISGAAPGGTTFWTNSVFMHPPGIQYVGTSSLTMGNSSFYMQPFQVQNVISASYIRHLVSVPAFGQTSQATSASTVTADWYATFYANIFSNGVGASSKSLQLYSAATAGMTHRWLFTLNATGNSYAWQITFPFEGANTNNTGTSYSQTSASASWATTGQQTRFTGIRWLDIPFAQSIPPGQYWMQFQRSTSSATTGGNFSNSTALTTNMTVYNVTQASLNAAPFNSAAAATNGLQLGLGVYTTNSSGGTTNSVPLNGISTIANQPVIPFQIIRQA